MTEPTQSLRSPTDQEIEEKLVAISDARQAKQREAYELLWRPWGRAKSAYYEARAAYETLEDKEDDGGAFDTLQSKLFDLMMTPAPSKLCVVEKLRLFEGDVFEDTLEHSDARELKWLAAMKADLLAHSL
ncbi:hypothetical protein [Parvularcula marina]|uniref:Uncharacterized protein n=1 Tax=Parvularcula marina TaxID=2292771 RepID=A0A371RGF9_9PROT|nr:hypothetical protein [Parvularcula marina]RFB04557.1 hypothetical protein DX908_04225 [Parvularcula marina]